ncbi:MAG: 2-deoxy-5-keto-D-gluconate 6-phosphate aldolase domain-containing protein [Jatrophihabitans sp.]
MTATSDWRPTHDDPLFILAMDHRGSFGKTLFDVEDDKPTDAQATAMRAAKDTIFRGLLLASKQLSQGRAGVLVDEQYGNAVIESASSQPVVLAVPVEASGHDWFTLEWGDMWREHVTRIQPAYAKVLVRDNPNFDAAQRRAQLSRLAEVSAGLAELGLPLLYELLVPATDSQLAQVGADQDRYDRELRPDLVCRVIADNQNKGIEPTLWKVEGLDTVEAARQVAEQVGANGRDALLIVLGRDAPAERLDHWLQIASSVERFVGFAIGRSIWEDVIRQHGTDGDDAAAAGQIADRYLGFTRQWAASG